MNYLAHIALAAPTDASRIGNLLGDFVKGTEQSLRLQLPADLVDGIMMHRAIDTYTDAHPAFLESKELLAPERKRYAGIVIDLIYDHFLCIHWDHFYKQPLDEFIQAFYQSLEHKKEWQLGKLKDAFPYMKSQNWLARYATIEGMNETLQRVSQRGKFTAPIAGTTADFKKHYSMFEKHFMIIYDDLIKFTAPFRS